MTFRSRDKLLNNIPSLTTIARASDRRPLLSVAGFFVSKAVIGFLILAISAKQLSVADFTTFSQLFLYLAMISSVAAAGVQNGVIREIAAAHGEKQSERVFVLGSLVLWACFAIAVAIIAIVFRERLAVVLVGKSEVGNTIAWLTISALLSGLGNILCSALSGSGRPSLSLAIQGIGLAVGGTLCLMKLNGGDATGAVLFYTVGPICSSVVAVWASRRWLNTVDVRWTEVHRIAVSFLGYSGTFIVVVSALPVVLFGVRYAYREDFGDLSLGYWLMANRASDVTTQVVGLYLSQVFLPHMTRITSGPERLREIRRTLSLGVSVAGAGATVFAIGSDRIISLVLSDRYLPALPFILGYLIGDVFRVGGNVALYSTLAARRLGMFMAIEVCLALSVGAAIMIGIAMGFPTAAYWGYICAHVLAFITVLLLAHPLSRL